MSGLMVSLAVVVAAILAVLVLVFSDQPATVHLRRRRAQTANGAAGGASWRPAATSAQARTRMLLRGPPPARVLQQQLALPSGRTRSLAPGSAAPVASPGRVAVTSAPDIDEGRLGNEEGVTVFTRLRSSVALLVLLAAVGSTVAIAIGIVLYLAGAALRHTLR